jgi:hypothetical protein
VLDGNQRVEHPVRIGLQPEATSPERRAAVPALSGNANA